MRPQTRCLIGRKVDSACGIRVLYSLFPKFLASDQKFRKKMIPSALSETNHSKDLPYRVTSVIDDSIQKVCSNDWLSTVR